MTRSPLFRFPALPPGLAALLSLLAAVPACAVTDTWDGNLPNAGAGDSLLSNGLNWADNSAPVSDLVNTDLIFAGTTKLAPVVGVALSTNSVVFNNTAGAFTFSGATLNVGTGGITNNDAQIQTFGNVLNLGFAASATVHAAAGPLTFSNLVTGPTALTVDGAFTTTFANLNTAGTILKQGIGTMSWNSTAATDADVTVATGTLTLSGNMTFNAAATIAVNGTNTLNINQGATLNGAQLTRATGATLAIAAGETLTVQNGGDVNITGTFSNAAASTVAVTGTGSTLSTTSTLGINSGNILNVSAGGDVTSGAGPVAIGTSGGNGTATVDGSGSSLGGASLGLGQAGVAGLVTYSNGSSGAFGAINVDNSGNAGTSGTLNIFSGATVTGTTLAIAPFAAPNNGTVTINGTNSALTLTGLTPATIGAASASTGTLNVQSGSTFNSNTGTMTVNATGTVDIAGSTFNANGNMTVNGQLMRDALSAFNLAAGRTLTVQSGGDATFTSGYAHTTASTITVTGSGSTFTNNFGTTSFDGGATLNVSAGGVVNAGLGLQISTLGPGLNTVNVDGSGSLLTASGFGNWGVNGGTANVTFSNSAAGNFGTLTLGSDAIAGSSATVLVQSGADVTSTFTRLANNPTAGTSASVTVSGAGSTWTVAGGNSLSVGAASGSTATLNVNSGGVFNSGTGNTVVDATGTIAIVGSTYNANGNLTLNGGQLTLVGDSALRFALGTSMTVQNGGDATIIGSFQQLTRVNLLVSGSGSTFSTAGDFQWEGGNSTISFVSVNNGGVLSSGGAVHLGRNDTAVSLSVSGAGSLLLASPFFTSEWHAGVLLTNSATANLGALRLADGGFFGESFGSLQVQSGATASFGNIAAATVIADATAAITVAGSGSTVTQTGASTLTLGAAFASSATLGVNSGGTFTSGTGAVTLNATSAINIDGGTVNLNGPITHNGGIANLGSGALNIVSNFKIGTGGLLGDGDITLPASKRFSTTGVTTIDAFRTLTLDGGTFRTGSLTNNGALLFNRGTLGITNAGGFSIGGGGALGSSVTLRDNARLEVTGWTQVYPGATLRNDGGSLTTAYLDVSGTVRADRGTLTPDALQIETGGRVFVADTIACATNTNSFILPGGRLTLENGGLVSGPGLIANSGLLTGDGTTALVFANQSGGEVRAESGKAIYFSAGTGTNDGRYNLQGGTLVFAGGFTNGTPGQLNGHGELYFPATPAPTVGAPAAGLNNSGAMNLSGGDSLIFGTVAVNGAGRVIASGGATATFFDVFRHSGAEVKASAGSALVFFGEVRGPGSFTGTGIVYMEGGYSPGASPASVSLAPQIVFTESNKLTLEIGGLTAGTQHDKLTFTHAATPQVTWGGTLTVALINGFTPAAGQSFDVLDFDATRDAGTFATLNLPTLPAGLTWDTAHLYTTGTIRVVGTSDLTFAQWAIASGIPGAVPNDDHDKDGYDNGTEFALGLFPPQHGTVLPNGGFFTYPEGERLRLLFTRPLDRTGVTLTVQGSDDLVTWTDLATSVNSAPFTGPGFVSENRAHPLPDPGLVEVRDLHITATTPRRQMRLRVTLAP